MADTKISALTASSGVAATDRIPAAIDPFATGDNRYITPAQIATYLDGVMGQPTAWTPTFTGFGSTPTNYTARYIKIGKWCTVWLTMAGSETSNATTFTITLPFTAANTTNQYGIIPTYVDNGVTSTTHGRIVTNANSLTATLTTNAAGAAWTASGIKRANFSFTYETT